MTFRVGQKVVCVDDAGTDETGRIELVRGTIYTVRWQGFHWSDYYPEPLYCVRLEEVWRKDEWVGDDNEDCPFRASRFRPLIETDISIFTAMLPKVDA
jgi:hypothetical protein